MAPHLRFWRRKSKPVFNEASVGNQPSPKNVLRPPKSEGAQDEAASSAALTTAAATLLTGLPDELDTRTRTDRGPGKLAFSCLALGCSDTFTSHDIWIEHLLEKHKFFSGWICAERNGSHYCREGFDDLDSFFDHLRDDHLVEYQEHLFWRVNGLSCMNVPGSELVWCGFCAKVITTNYRNNFGYDIRDASNLEDVGNFEKELRLERTQVYSHHMGLHHARGEDRPDWIPFENRHAPGLKEFAPFFPVERYASHPDTYEQDNEATSTRRANRSSRSRGRTRSPSPVWLGKPKSQRHKSCESLQSHSPPESVRELASTPYYYSAPPLDPESASPILVQLSWTLTEKELQELSKDEVELSILVRWNVGNTSEGRMQSYKPPWLDRGRATSQTSNYSHDSWQSSGKRSLASAAAHSDGGSDVAQSLEKLLSSLKQCENMVRPKWGTALQAGIRAEALRNTVKILERGSSFVESHQDEAEHLYGTDLAYDLMTQVEEFHIRVQQELERDRSYETLLSVAAAAHLIICNIEKRWQAAEVARQTFLESSQDMLRRLHGG